MKYYGLDKLNEIRKSDVRYNLTFLSRSYGILQACWEERKREVENENEVLHFERDQEV